MILVIVGMHYQSFNRLLIEMDNIAANIEEQVIMQIGHSTYEPKYARWFRYISESQMKILYSEASLIISHGGAGSIINAIQNKKPLIAVPRLKFYNEHVDDQQLEICNKFAQMGYLKTTVNVNELMNLINHIKNENFESVVINHSKIVNYIKNILLSEQ